MLVMVACDPNESGVPDGIDFKDSSLQKNGNNLSVSITFYGNYNSTSFFFYIDTDNDPEADYLVRCSQGEFSVAGETQPGLYDDYTANGSPNISGRQYDLEFAFSAIGIDPSDEFNFRYWFYEMTEGDRMPNSGEKVFAFVM
jgi:hypothetical protein